VFSARKGQFVEFDRETRQWKPVSYDIIMAVTPIAAA
jgi:hypothetical protein